MSIQTLSNTRNLKTANGLRDLGLYPFFRAIQTSDGSTVTVKNKKQVMIGSNNYLGLTHHPHVIEQTQKAVSKYGTGCTGSRFLNGNLEVHEELEERLAAFMNKEKAIVFSTGMQVNLGAISALCGPRDCILSDSENHASIIDGTRLALGTTFKYKHNDMLELEELLESKRSQYRNVFIVTDGVFSMTGDLAKLPEINKLAKKYDAWVYVDDAHGAGVMGDLGRGTANFFDQETQTPVIMGTFSKSFASIGGFLVGDTDTIDYVKHAARSFMFSASMPPSAVATVSACLDIIYQDKTLFQRLWDNVAFMKKGLESLGFYTYSSQTPIIPILVGDDVKAMQVTQFLQEHGVFATPVISPAVPKGQALIRTSYMASHQERDLSFCLDVFAKVAKAFDLPSAHQNH